MKKVLELTNRYIVIATPLLLFLILIVMYFLIVLQSGQPFKVLFGAILMFFMVIAFTAGWGNMLKSAIHEKDYDDPYLIIKDFAPGVGEYFLPVLGAMFFLFVIYTVISVLMYICGVHFIGDVGVTSEALSKALASNEALKQFLTSLSTEQLMKLNAWNIMVLSVSSFLGFLTMFYFPALFLEIKNPFKALFVSLKHVFSKKLPQIIGIFLLIFSVNCIISILSTMLSGNAITSFIMTLVNFYFICCVVIGIFYYYNKNFVDNHLGNSIDTYI